MRQGHGLAAAKRYETGNRCAACLDKADVHVGGGLSLGRTPSGSCTSSGHAQLPVFSTKAGKWPAERLAFREFSASLSVACVCEIVGAFARAKLSGIESRFGPSGTPGRW